jgi:broad specificity phosphatase PhoE
MELHILPDGTKLSGFVRAESNEPPRECHNCVWYKHDTCRHPVVMVDPEVPGDNGKPKPVGDHDCCNFFRSPSKLLIVGLRHGTTEANEEGLHRGWMDIPLDEKGKADAKEAANEVQSLGVTKIYCSDLDRGIETAQIVGEELGIEPVPDFRLRPWNKGIYQGQPKDETKEEFQFYIDNPNVAIPGGESLNDFTKRYYEVLEEYLEEAQEGVILIVFHTSNAIGTANYVEGKDREQADREIVQPGGILLVGEKDGKLDWRPIFKEQEQGTMHGS